MLPLSTRLRSFLVRRPSRAAYQFLMKDWTRIRDLDALARVLATQRFSEQLAPIVSSGPTADRILVLSPHPDDDTLGCGGALLHARQRGASVRIIHVTSGEANSDATAAHAREAEALAVAEVLGATVACWAYPTRAVPDDVATRIRDEIASFNPGVIFLPFLADDHPDHRRIAELFALAYRDMPPPDIEVWAYQVYSAVLPNVVVDMTDVMDEKERLVRMWESQHAHRDWAHYVRGMNAWGSRFLHTPGPRYAEHYFVVPAREYIELCRQYFPMVAAS